MYQNKGGVCIINIYRLEKNSEINYYKVYVKLLSRAAYTRVYIIERRMPTPN